MLFFAMYTNGRGAVLQLVVDKLNLTPTFVGKGVGSYFFKGVCQVSPVA